MMEIARPAFAAASLFAAAGTAAAQSDPAGFGTVYNTGTGPFDPFFDVTGAVSGTRVGDGDFDFGEAFVTPTFLAGDVLGSDSQLNLFDGGEILFGFRVGPAGIFEPEIEVNVFGGTIGDQFTAESGSTINVSGGSISGNFIINSGSTVNISGGGFGDRFEFRLGILNRFGTSFLLDGVVLTGLVPGEAFTITDRDVILTGTFKDGTAFDFDLNSVDPGSNDFLNPSATLTVTVVAGSAPTSTTMAV